MTDDSALGSVARAARGDSGAAAHLANQVIVGNAVLQSPVRDLIGVNRIGQDSSASWVCPR
jgi:hypothetical protein